MKKVKIVPTIEFQVPMPILLALIVCVMVIVICCIFKYHNEKQIQAFEEGYTFGYIQGKSDANLNQIDASIKYLKKLKGEK